jgi:hypothetical protein
VADGKPPEPPLRREAPPHPLLSLAASGGTSRRPAPSRRRPHGRRCSSADTDSNGSPAATITPGTNSTPDPSPTEDAQPSALEAEANGGEATCSARTTRHQSVSLYDPIGRAHGDLTITAVSATGSDVALAGKSDLSTRTDLVGMSVADGQRILPLVRVEVDPHSELAGIWLTYTWGDGTDTAEVLLPVHTRFAAGMC